MASRFITSEYGSTLINRNQIETIYVDEKPCREKQERWVVLARTRGSETQLASFPSKTEAKAWMIKTFKPRTKED